MYQYVESNEVKRYRSYCSKVLGDVRDDLYDSFGINTNFSLVGSGGDARNMVTRNGNAPFDLDYNLYIISMPDEFWDDLRKLKETVRCSLNKAVDNLFFSDGKDSTSVITSILHFNDSPEIKFSFDVAILAKNSDGEYCRLIHNKNYGLYYETKKYVFVHGWIPCNNRRGWSANYYSAMDNWREAGESSWKEARWINGMLAYSYGVVEKDKTIVCGHWHSSWGHCRLEGKCSEFGKDGDFSPFYADGIIAIDGCTAYSGKVNCIVLEDENI